MSMISSQVTELKNTTAQYQAANEKKATGTTELDSNAFLMLMLKELEFQDPMDPVTNKEFIAQQAQLNQVTQMQKLNSNLTTNNTIMQTLALVGKEVTLLNPDDPNSTITGNVTEANFDSNSASITVDGKSYPITLIKSVRGAETTPTASASN